MHDINCMKRKEKLDNIMKQLVTQGDKQNNYISAEEITNKPH